MTIIGAGVRELRIRDVNGAFRVIYLATLPKGVASALELGQDLFGRSYTTGAGLEDLASRRKAYAAGVWDEVAEQKMSGGSGASGVSGVGA